MKAMVFNIAKSWGGKHAEQFLDRWRGTLVSDNFPDYQALFKSGMMEAGCMAHARRKFHELWANHSHLITREVLKLYARLYDMERETSLLDPEQHFAIHQAHAKPVADALHQWLLVQRQQALGGGATFKEIEYSLNRWSALTHYLKDPRVAIDNN